MIYGATFGAIGGCSTMVNPVEISNQSLWVDPIQRRWMVNGMGDSLVYCMDSGLVSGR